MARAGPGEAALSVRERPPSESTAVLEEIGRRVLWLATLMHRTAEPGHRPSENAVEIWATGIVVPEALRAAEELRLDGIGASVVNCVSPDLVYRCSQAAGGSRTAEGPAALPRRSGAPVVTVIDGHPSALAWVGSMLGVRAWPLGVSRYGESGTHADLYRDHGIGAAAIRRAAHAALAEDA